MVVAGRKKMLQKSPDPQKKKRPLSDCAIVGLAWVSRGSRRLLDRRRAKIWTEDAGVKWES